MLNKEGKLSTGEPDYGYPPTPGKHRHIVKTVYGTMEVSDSDPNWIYAIETDTYVPRRKWRHRVRFFRRWFWRNAVYRARKRVAEWIHPRDYWA